MSTTAWIIAGVAAYLFFFATPAPQPVVAEATPSQTRIVIPGVGEYINVAGGQSVSIMLDPNFLSTFGG